MKSKPFQLKVEDASHEIVIDIYDDSKETIGFFRLQDIDNPRNSFARLVYHRGLEACRCIPSYIDDDAHYSPGFITYVDNNNIPHTWELEIKNYYKLSQTFLKAFLEYLKNWLLEQNITISDNLVVVLRNCDLSQNFPRFVCGLFNPDNIFKIFESSNTQASWYSYEHDKIHSIMLLTDKPLINFLETYEI